MSITKLKSKTYGYARVSTDEQSFDHQVEDLAAAGCIRVFREKVSGGVTDRRELAKALAQIERGDTLVVTRLDRLARSSRDLLNIIHDIGAKGAAFRSLSEPWADTTTPGGRLMVTVLGGLAEFERSLIRSRTSEGRERALRNGVKFGRKPVLTPHQVKEAVARRENGESLKSIAKTFNVSHSTISRLKPPAPVTPNASY